MKIELQRNGTLLEQDERLLKQYFAKVVELANNERTNRFVVDMDDVWPLAYARRQECVRALRSSFVENEDFIIREKESTGGRPGHFFMLSLNCMEFLVVRKVCSVFSVYRQVLQGPVGKSFENSCDFQEGKPLAYEIPGEEDLNTPLSQRTFDKGWVNLSQYGWRDFFYFFAMESEQERKRQAKTPEEQWKDVLLAMINFTNLSLHIMLDRHIMEATTREEVKSTIREMNMWRSYMETHNIVTKEPLKRLYYFDSSAPNIFRVLTKNIPEKEFWPSNRPQE